MSRIGKIIDLSMDITNDITVYPGDIRPDIRPVMTVEKDGCRVSQLLLGSHTGTHVDAPAHFINSGKTIEQLELPCFMGEALIIKIPGKKPGYAISLADLAPYATEISGDRIILFRTDWQHYAGTAEFFDHPYLTVEVAAFLIERGVKTVGVDCLNVDRTIDEEDFPIHHLFLPQGIVIAENLTNLDKIDFPHPYVMLLPLKVVGADGSPVRAIAMELQ